MINQTAVITPIAALSQLDAQSINGGGTGTGAVVQNFQNFSKDLYGVPFPVAYRPFIGANGWGKLVSESFSKID